MEFIDYYKILEIDKKASESDIKKTYRKLARKYHPDLNPNDAATKLKFQQINEANEVLSDPEKRKKYDAYGKDWKNASEFEKAGQRTSGQSHGEQPFTNESFNEDDFSDFFGSMFGEGRRRTQFRGQDLNAGIHLSLRDVFKTHQQTVNVNGKNIRFTVPAGAENGQTIKISGHGGSGANGGPAGDLYVTFVITNHPTFKREGNNLYATVPLDLYVAMLGGDITIDTFDGQVKIIVKPGTANGATVRLKGKGFPVYKKEGESGDLFITWKIALPAKLSEKEIELFKELSNLRQHGKE